MTTVLTMTITSIAADSSFAKGNNPRLLRRVASIVAIFFGGALGAVVISYSLSAALTLAAATSIACTLLLWRSARTSREPAPFLS